MPIDKTSKNDCYIDDSRYTKTKICVELGQNSEQRKWEDEVIHTSLLHFGLLGKGLIYDYILSKEIQLVQQ